jgi:hypothetical protein
LSSEQLTRKQKLDSLSYAETPTLIYLGDLPALQQDGILSLEIPQTETIHEFKANHVESFENGDYTWTGDLVTNHPAYCTDDNDDNDTDICFVEGFAILLKRGNDVFGEIQIDTITYEI